VPFPGGVHEPEGVHARPAHHPVAARHAVVRHHPDDGVHRLRGERHEVPEGVVRGARLRHLVVRFGLDRVHQVRELDRVLDEEHRDVVADEVEVALLGVELGREAADVADGVGRAAEADDGGEPHEHRRLPSHLTEEVRAGDVVERIGALEDAVGAGATRVHDAFGDALVVEARHLLPEVEVLDERGTAISDLQRVVRVVDLDALVGRQVRPVVGHPVLVELVVLLVARAAAPSWTPSGTGRARCPSASAGARPTGPADHGDPVRSSGTRSEVASKPARYVEAAPHPRRS
jgi:hypothetical protein